MPERSVCLLLEYEDRVTQMLAQALTSIGGEYIDYPMEFHELERKMEAKRIAGKNDSEIGSESMEVTLHMAKKQSFPTPGCRSCQNGFLPQSIESTVTKTNAVSIWS